VKNNQLRTIIKRDQDLCGNTYGKTTGQVTTNIHYENKKLQYLVTLTNSQISYPNIQEYKKRSSVLYRTLFGLKLSATTDSIHRFNDVRSSSNQTLKFDPSGILQNLAFVADSKKKLA